MALFDQKYVIDPPKTNRDKKCDKIEQLGKELLSLIDEQCEDGEAKSFSVTNLDRAIMWACIALPD